MPQPSPELINLAVEKVFQRYDINRNGFLEPKQIYGMLNDTIKKVNHRKKQVTNSDVSNFMRQFDTSKDGKLGKKQLLDIFNKVIRIL